MTRISAVLLAGLLISCGGGGSDGSTGGNTPGTTTGGTPAPDTTGGSTPPTCSSDRPHAPAGAPIEETNPAVTFSTGWTSANTRYGWSGTRARQSAVAGATATLCFTGKSVRWIGRRSTGSGIVRVKLDGGPGFELDLYAKPFEVRTPIITLNDLADGPHRLTIEVTGRQNPLASGNLVVVDAFEVEPQIVSHLQESDPDATFSAGWVKAEDRSEWSGGHIGELLVGGARVTETAGEIFTLKFRGTSIRWIGYRGPNAGIARVQVDGGVPAVVDLYSAREKFQEVVFAANGLPDTTHTLTIEATGQKNPLSTGATIVVDAFDVTTPGKRYQEWTVEGDPRTTPGGPRITYVGIWDHNINRVWSEGASFGGEFGSSATFSFTGTSVSWIGSEKESIGRARIYIDGARVQDVDMKKPVPIEGYQRTIYRKDGLTNGPHTITVEARGGGKIVIDAFDVHP